MAVTIKDVAKLAGVSPSTVSRVLAGNPRISPETQERVRKVMRAINYHPNGIARSLARQRTQTLGLIIARPLEQAFANPFFPEVIRGIGAELQGQGYSLLLSTTENPRDERNACLQLVRGRRVDGIILTSSQVHDPLVRELAEAAFPFVLIGRAWDTEGVTWVNNDNLAVGQMATEHLYRQGYRRIAMINGPADLVVSADREAGYSQALAALGESVDPALIVHTSFTQEAGYRAMETLLGRTSPPLGVFAADDVMALGAVKYLQERGLRIPGDVGIVGVNDDPVTSYIQPSLTTIRVPIFDLGRTAAQLLIDMVADRSDTPRHVVLPVSLVVRHSTGPGPDARAN